jgi:tRNA-dihydrouridine synthase
MIGRAAIGYPWIFNEIKHFLATGTYLPAPTIQQRMDVCMAHLDFSIRWKGEHGGIVEMRRHYSNYFRGLDHFKPFRTRLVTSMSHEEIQGILMEIAQTYQTEFA